MTRQMSTDSVSSINSMSSACSFTSQQSAATDGDIGKKKKKKGWVRNTSNYTLKFFCRSNTNSHNPSQFMSLKKHCAIQTTWYSVIFSAEKFV